MDSRLSRAAADCRLCHVAVGSRLSAEEGSRLSAEEGSRLSAEEGSRLSHAAVDFRENNNPVLHLFAEILIGRATDELSGPLQT